VSRLFPLFSYHLLPSVTLAFILGIVADSFSDNILPGIFPAFPILLSLLVLTSLFQYRGYKRPVYWLLLLLFFGLGWQRATMHSLPPQDPDHIYNRITEKQEVIIVGTLTAMPQYKSVTNITRVRIATSALQYKQQKIFTGTRGNIILRLKGKWPHDIFPGDLLVIRAELQRPQSFLSPGSFDYSRYLAGKGIWITGKIGTPLHIHKLSNKPSLADRVRYFPEKLRQRIAAEINVTIPPRLSGLYRAILLGDRSGVDGKLQEQFKAAGVMHILAISGIHMGVLGTLLFFLFYQVMRLSEALLLRIRIRKAAALLTLPVLLFYSSITGLNAPVIRAVIMSSIVITALCIDRKKSSPELFSGAALGILLYSPLQLFTASFQLSFSAVAAILFILPDIKKIISPHRKNEHTESFPASCGAWIATALLVSLVATLATSPISLYYFNRLSFVGPVANLVIEPLLCLWSLLFGFLSLPFFFILPSIGEFLLKTGSYGLTAAIECVRFFSALSFSDFYLPTPPVILIFLYYPALYLLFFLRKKDKMVIVSILFFSGSLFAYFFFSPFDSNTAKQNFTVSFLDVGQGSATVVTFPSGYRVLIDGGGSSYLSTSVGRRVIAPYLWRKGISRIDTVIITHPDADHYNGLPFIIDHFSPSIIWVNTFTGHDHLFTDLLEKARETGVEIRLAENGEYLDKRRKIQCIANTTSLPGARRGENNGLVIRAAAENISILFPGDIGKKTEKSLVDSQFSLKSTILLSPHHGSATSNSELFLRETNPQVMIVSAGKTRKKIFPHAKLEQLCRDNKITLLTTAKSGTIEIIADGSGYTISGHRKKNNNPLLTIESYNVMKKMY
jgi:competence protein ComEC